MDHITFADAMELFKLPRTLGQTEAGETIVANVGRFGPYVKYGSKYASLKEDDPYTVTLERAREVIRLKQEADANRIIQDFPDAGIQVLNGRYGPYITDKKKNAKIPKERDPKSVTLEECRTMLAAAPERGRFGRWGRKKATPAAVSAGAEAPAPAAPAQPPKAARHGKKAARETARGDGAALAPARAQAPAHPVTAPATHGTPRSATRARKARAKSAPARKTSAAKPRSAAGGASARARRLK
jgi:DNA topoisomerase-1